LKIEWSHSIYHFNEIIGFFFFKLFYSIYLFRFGGAAHNVANRDHEYFCNLWEEYVYSTRLVDDDQVDVHHHHEYMVWVPHQRGYLIFHTFINKRKIREKLRAILHLHFFFFTHKYTVQKPRKPYGNVGKKLGKKRRNEKHSFQTFFHNAHIIIIYILL
jgi:hypothetical protein